MWEKEDGTEGESGTGSEGRRDERENPIRDERREEEESAVEREEIRASVEDDEEERERSADDEESAVHETEDDEEIADGEEKRARTGDEGREAKAAEERREAKAADERREAKRESEIGTRRKPDLQMGLRQRGGDETRQEFLYKVLVIGELGAGKTSIIKRCVHQFFSQHYRATIGVDFALKRLEWDDKTLIRVQLWDIAGQERFGNMTRIYYKDAVGCFVVFDVTRTATFDAVLKWKRDLDSKVQLPDGSPVPCVLLANKCDLPKEGTVTEPAKMEEFCKEKGFLGWFDTSAKDNIGIDEALHFLVSKVQAINIWTMLEPDSPDRIALSPVDSGNKPQSSRCSAC